MIFNLQFHIILLLFLYYVHIRVLDYREREKSHLVTFQYCRSRTVLVILLRFYFVNMIFLDLKSIHDLSQSPFLLGNTILTTQFTIYSTNFVVPPPSVL